MCTAVVTNFLQNEEKNSFLKAVSLWTSCKYWPLSCFRNHRKVEVWRDCGGHSTQSSWWGRTTEGQLPQTMSRWLWNSSKNGDSTTSLSSLCLVKLTGDVSWCSARPFCVQVVSAACPVTGHHWQKPACIFFNPPCRGLLMVHQWWFTIDDIPQSFFIWEVLQPLTHLRGASLVSLHVCNICK